MQKKKKARDTHKRPDVHIVHNHSAPSHSERTEKIAEAFASMVIANAEAIKANVEAIEFAAKALSFEGAITIESSGITAKVGAVVTIDAPMTLTQAVAGKP